MADLEKVIDYFQAALRMKNEYGFCILPFETVEDAIELLKNANRVKVVRCSDCRFWEPPTDIEADDGCTAGHCRNNYGPCQNQQTDMTWFCADCERVEE